jgi:hypothetical protein
MTEGCAARSIGVSAAGGFGATRASCCRDRSPLGAGGGVRGRSPWGRLLTLGEVSGDSCGAEAEAELHSFGEALDRANEVAQALIKLGVPARAITVQTAPELADGGLAAGQVVVLLEY